MIMFSYATGDDNYSKCTIPITAEYSATIVEWSDKWDCHVNQYSAVVKLTECLCDYEDCSD